MFWFSKCWQNWKNFVCHNWKMALTISGPIQRTYVLKHFLNIWAFPLHKVKVLNIDCRKKSCFTTLIRCLYLVMLLFWNHNPCGRNIRTQKLMKLRHVLSISEKIGIYILNWSNKQIGFFFNFGGHRSFLWCHWHTCFGVLLMPPLGFKARVGSLIHRNCSFYLL